MTTWTFYFDFISPYAFLGWKQIRPIAARVGREVDPVPVLFAALLGAHGTKGPAEVPAKRAYLFRDVARKAFRAGIPEMRPPPAHPFHPLTALRAASLPASPETRARVVDALFDAAWIQGRAIDTPESVASALTKAGLDGVRLSKAAGEDEAKARLREQTDRSLGAGVFGVPTIFGEGEMFWGTDALVDLELRATGKMPSSSELVAGVWENLPMGVTRSV